MQQDGYRTSSHHNTKPDATSTLTGAVLFLARAFVASNMATDRLKPAINYGKRNSVLVKNLFWLVVASQFRLKFILFPIIH